MDVQTLKEMSFEVAGTKVEFFIYRCEEQVFVALKGFDVYHGYEPSELLKISQMFDEVHKHAEDFQRCLIPH